MKIIFWGTLFDPDKSLQLLEKSKVGLQTAANVYQWGFIEGLVNNDQRDIKIISALPVGSYPKYNNKLIYHNDIYTKKNKTIIVEPGFINFYLIREYIRKKKFYKTTKSYLRIDDKIVIFIYSLYLPFVSALKKLKEEFKNQLHVCLIIPDLPGVYGILRDIRSPAGVWDRLIAKTLLDHAQYADSYVLLSKQMKDVLKINKPYCVIEGFYSHIDINLKRLNKINGPEKIIMYTGSFNPEFGIDNLIKSFTAIEDANFRLWLCGPPSERMDIRTAHQIDSRIKYLGYLPKEHIVELQEKCTLLINPRENKGNYVKYSFPSKTIEYLASGKPTVMYKLEGIPAEYDKYLYYIEGTLKDKIIEVAYKSPEELERIGNQAKAWLLKEKNSKSQVLKVLEMVRNIL